MTNQTDVKSYLDTLINKDETLLKAHSQFTDKVCELLGITKDYLESITSPYQLKLYLPTEKVFLIASCQNLLGWHTFFHITKENVGIHNILSRHAFDWHKIAGTGTYSFTKDEALINRIYKSIECKDYAIV